MSKSAMAKAKVLSLGITLLAFQAGVVRGEEAADKIAELKKLREKMSTLHVISTAISRSGSGTRETRIETWERNRDGKRMLRRIATSKTDPGTPKEQVGAPSLMVNDGVTAWREMDMGDKKMVFKGKADSRNEYYDIEPLANANVAKFSPADKLLDHPCVLLEIREKANPDDIIASYWISERNGVVLKSIVESAGATITETKVIELQQDGDIPDTYFKYRPPADAQVIENK